MMSARQQAQNVRSDAHFWDFGSMDELRRALTEYTALLDGTLVRRYAEPEPGGPPPPTPEQVAEYERTVLRQRSTIDVAMEQMEPQYRMWYRVIDLYYRQGLSTEPQGWLVLMSRLGLRYKKCPPLVRCVLDRGVDFEDNRLELPKCRQATRLCCHWDYDTFEIQITRAIEALWRAIRGRSEWTP
jgi:hypothetical protein